MYCLVACVDVCIIQVVLDFSLYFYSSDWAPSTFFFQAEDGIRDLVRSRGLGDVYKRQCDHMDNPGDRPHEQHVDLYRYRP